MRSSGTHCALCCFKISTWLFVFSLCEGSDCAVIDFQGLGALTSLGSLNSHRRHNIQKTFRVINEIQETRGMREPAHSTTLRGTLGPIINRKTGQNFHQNRKIGRKIAQNRNTGENNNQNRKFVSFNPSALDTTA